MLPKNSCQRFIDKRWQLILKLDFPLRSVRLGGIGTPPTQASAPVEPALPGHRVCFPWGKAPQATQGVT